MIKWLDDVTNKIIENAGNSQIITCQCGISTTGVAHIGNFREPIITYFVAEALKQKGKKVRLVMSFDDFDRFKKVPYGVPSDYEKYVGMPTCFFPSHINSSISYAKFYEDKIIETLKSLDIDMEYIYQSEKYKAKEYLSVIKSVLDQKDAIFDIISKYKTQQMTYYDKKQFFPVKVYCSCCRKDNTTIMEYSQEENLITYKCSCGHMETASIDKLDLKLKFNVEWPARWNYENVNFEPCGKGHAEELGVLNVSKEINEKIYHKKNPCIVKYDFFNLKGNQGRMNKNSKNFIEVKDFLNVMPKEMVLYYFIVNPPNKEMSFSIEDDIPKFYEMFEKCVNNNCLDYETKSLLKIDYKEDLKFSDLIRYLPVVNFDVENLKKILQFSETKHNLEKITCAINWLKFYSKNKYWVMNDNINYDYYNTLSSERKKTLSSFIKLAKKYSNFLSWKEFFETFKQYNPDLKMFYKDFYGMIFDSETGIPIKSLFEYYDIEKIINLIPVEENIKNKNKNQVDDTVRIIHLSDLHFDINDSKEILSKKIQMITDYLKKGNYDNYLIISGDIICFYNKKENFDMAYDYLSFLVDSLHIPVEKILICTGNHEMISFDKFLNTYFDNYNIFLREKLQDFNEFMKKLCAFNINESEELYYMNLDLPFNTFVVNSLFGIIDGKKQFFQSSELIERALKKEKINKDKLGFVISHAPYGFNSSLFDNTNILNFFNYNICGHNHEKSIIYNENGLIDLVSGSSDGLVGDEYDFNLYELKNGVYVKRIFCKDDITTARLKRIK